MMSLHYYPLEDLERTRPHRPEGWGAQGSDIWPLAIINLVLAMAAVNFAVGGSLIGTLIVLALIAAFNMLMLTGGSQRRDLD
jgi:hypothetical protein